MRSLINKVFSGYISIRYPHIEKHLRYFIRDTFYCQLFQWKFFFKDFLFRKKYKTISFYGEFGPELLFVLPFAYWHYKNGTLKATRSCSNMAEFYYFSPDHGESPDLRSNEGNYNYQIPRILYSHNYNIKKWLAVPLKEIYKNDFYVFEKPIVIVANRYNSEWGGPPISYLSVEILEFIFDNLKSDYTVIYNRPSAHQITMDNSEIYDLDEYGWIKRNYPEVILMNDLYQENKSNAKNFNHLQLMVYSNADNFISTHGGTAILASYFKGTNIILSKKGPEHVFNCFEDLYTKLSGSRILHAKTDSELRSVLKQSFIKQKKEISQPQ